MIRKFLIYLACLSFISGKAQLCSGTLGAPVFFEDFGSGPLYGPPLPAGVTNYPYMIGIPNNGTYVISNSSDPSGVTGLAGSYIIAGDHTGNVNGYMMVVNSDYAPTEVYRKHITGLCQNTTYVFSSYLANNDDPAALGPVCGASYIYANIKFQTEYPIGTVQGSVTTGNLPIGSSITSHNWQQYGFVFTTLSGQTSVDVVLKNNAPGGCGNDYVVDDISLSPCGPGINLNILPNYTVFCVGSSATLQSTYSSGAYVSPQYQWQFSNDNGVTWNDMVGATSPNYSIPVITSSDFGLYRLYASESGNINLPSCRIIAGPITFTVAGMSVNSATVCASQQATLTATGATSYTWSTGATTNSIIVSPSITTSYNVTGVTGGCSNSAVSTVSVIPMSSIAVAGNTLICYGNTTTLTTSGVGTCTWSTGYIGNALTVTPLTSINYTVTSSVSGSCNNVSTVSVTVIPQPVITVTDGTICAGNSFTLSPSGANTYTYSGGSSIVTPTVNTNYTITGTNTQGCTGSVTSSVTVVVQPTLTVNSGTVCSGSSFTLTPAGANSYTFSGGSAIVSPTANTTYSVIGTNTIGCTVTNTVISSVTVIPQPVLSVNSGTVCSGNSFTLNPVGAVTYTYSGGSAVVAPLISSDYTVTAANAQGCINSVISSVTVSPYPLLSVNSGTICSGSSFTFSPSGANTYTFSGGSQTVTPTANTVFTITGSNTQGCTGSITSTVTVVAQPTLTVADGSVCSGNSFTINPLGAFSYTYSSGSAIISPASTASYTITGSNSTVCPVSNAVVCTVTVVPIPVLSVNSGTICEGSSFAFFPTGASTYTFSGGSATVTPASTTNYTVTGSNLSSCSSSVTALVNVVPKPTFTLSTSTPSLCLGKSAVLNVAGISNYMWSTGQTTNSISVTTATTTAYSVTGTNITGILACSATQTILVTVVPQATVSVFGNDSICRGSSTIIYAIGASSYSWSPFTTLSNPKTFSVSVNPTITTIYSVTASNTIDCPVTVTLQVVVNPLPSVNAGRDTTINIDESYMLSGTGNVSVGFLSPSASPLICNFCANVEVNPKETTCYILKGENGHRCAAFDEVCINVTKDWDVFIPNAFTPNDDKDNDVFIPIGYGISEIMLDVFDRWGTQIFKSSNEVLGWDGKLNGKVCEQGVYTYKINLITMAGAEVSKVGHVSLIGKGK